MQQGCRVGGAGRGVFFLLRMCRSAGYIILPLSVVVQVWIFSRKKKMKKNYSEFDAREVSLMQAVALRSSLICFF